MLSVDDNHVANKYKGKIIELKEKLSLELEINDLGPLGKIFGIDIHRMK